MVKNKPTYDELAARVSELEAELAAVTMTMPVPARKDDKWYRNLLDNAFDAIFVLDAEFNYVEVNKRATELFWYSRQEFLQMQVFDVIPADQVPHSKRELKALKERGSYEKFIGKMRRKDGVFVDIEVSSCAVYDGGKIAGSIDIIRDITERLEIEKEVRQLKQQIEYILAATRTGINVIDRDYNLRYVDPGWQKIYGEYKGRKCFDFFKGRTSVCKECVVRIAFDKKQAMVTEEILVKEDSRPVQVTAIPFQNDHGEWLVAEVHADISRRKKVEEELGEYRSNLEGLIRNRTGQLTQTNELLKLKIKQRNEAEMARRTSEDKYRRLVENLKEDYFLFSQDKEGNFTSASSSVFNILGYEPDKFLVHYTEFLTPNPLNAEMIESTSLCLTGVLQPSFEVEVFDHTGAEHWLEISEAPILDGDDNIVGIEGIAHDVTTRKRTEKEMLKTQKLESTGLLAGGIAHDFNNLLTAVVGNLSIAKMYAEPDSKVFVKLEDIERASWRARDLTQQLLTFSKGGAPVTKSESITAMIKDSTWFTLSGSNVKCEFTDIDILWQVEVDEGQICQVIQNIATNADQAMPEGGILRAKGANIHIEADDERGLGQGRYVEISFADTGNGIAPEYLDKIFDPYFTTKQKGSGLGLSICYSIIKNHHGLLSVDSELGNGSVFTIYLPAAEEKSLPVEEESVSTEARKGTGRILLMDDEDIVREIGAEMLAHLGYEPTTAKDGGEALALYEEAMQAGKPFAAVIMDLTVPGGMGGREATGQITKLDPQVKAVVSSGYANDEIMANFREYGFVDLIPKPYKIEDLGQILARVLETG